MIKWKLGQGERHFSSLLQVVCVDRSWLAFAEYWRPGNEQIVEVEGPGLNSKDAAGMILRAWSTVSQQDSKVIEPEFSEAVNHIIACIWYGLGSWTLGLETCYKALKM